MQFEFALLKEDLRDYNYFTVWSDPYKKKDHYKFYLRYWLRISVPTFFLIMLANNGQLNLKAVREFAIVGLAGIILSLLTGKWAIRYGLGKRIEKFMADPLNKDFLDLKTYNINDVGIFYKSSGEEAFVRWEGFARNVETDSAFYFFLSSNSALIFPKRIIDNLRLKQLEAILQRNNLFKTISRGIKA